MIDSDNSCHPKRGTACCGHTVVIFTAVIVPKHGTTACKPPTQHGMIATCRHPKRGMTWSTYNYSITTADTSQIEKLPPKAWYDLKQPALQVSKIKYTL